MIIKRHLLIAYISLAVSLSAQSVDTTPVRTFKHNKIVWTVSFSPDGRYLATGSRVDDTTKLWEVATGREVRSFEKSDGFSVSFSPDGRYLATLVADVAKMWEVATGQLVRTFDAERKLPGWSRSASFSPDGRYLALSGDIPGTGYNFPAQLWEVATGELVRLFSHNARSVSFSPDGRYLVTGSLDKSAKLWEVATGREIRTFKGHVDGIWSVSYSPDGTLLATGSSDGTAILWDVATGRQVRSLIVSESGVKSVSFSPDGRHLATGIWGHTTELWEVNTGLLVRTFKGRKTVFGINSVNSISFSPDGRYLVTGSHEKTAQLWDVSDIVSPPLPETNIRSVSLPTVDISSRPSIAIIDFTADGVSAQEARVLTKRVGTLLVQLGRHQVVEREQMIKILDEHNFQETGCTDNECAVEIGKIIGAQLMMAGSIGRFGTLYTIDMRIIDVETSRVLKTTAYNSEGSLNRLLTEGVSAAVKQITGME